MPAVHYEVCQGLKYEDGEIVVAHGENCRQVNHHRHGRLRWFLSTFRCYCECHEPKTYVIDESPDVTRIA